MAESMTTTIINEVNAVIAAFMMPRVKVALDDGAFLPVRAHRTDAGADLFLPEGACDEEGRLVVPAHGSVSVDTGVHVQLPPHTDAEIWSKSKLNVEHGITATGLIDEGYSGAIIVKLYNHTDDEYVFRAGDKLTQIVIRPVCYPTYEPSYSIEGGERGDAGFGSTGR